MKEGADNKVLTQCAAHAQYVLQLLQIQQKTGFLCDITIKVKNCSFKAHKPLLAACSLYFRALFADINTNESTALNLTSLTPTGFEVLLNYIYSGNLSINAENSSEVLSAATCLQMSNVVETCLSFIRSSFRMSKTDELKYSKSSLAYDISHFSSTSTSRMDTSSVPKTMARKLNLSSTSELQLKPFVVPQKNLQIVSATTIDEAEFKDMLTDKRGNQTVAKTGFNFRSPYNVSSSVNTGLMTMSGKATSSSIASYLPATRISSQINSNTQLSPSLIGKGASPVTESSTLSISTCASVLPTTQYQRSGSRITYSSDEHDNSVEISSDEESVSNVWSIERSASQPSDLSKTPYVASTLKGTAQQSPVNLCNKADDCSRSSTNAIPPQSLVTSSSRIITYEKAKQAMSVLCYPSSTSPFCNEESNAEKSDLSTISSEVIQKTLLPKKLSKNASRSSPSSVVVSSSADHIKSEPQDDKTFEPFVSSSESVLPEQDKQRHDDTEQNTDTESEAILDLSVSCQPRSSFIISPGLASSKEGSNTSGYNVNLNSPLVCDSEILSPPLSMQQSLTQTSELNLVWSRSQHTPPSLARSLSLFSPRKSVDEDLDSWDPPTDVFSSSGADLSFKFDPNKSRRDVAGFTCTWPACGRWFRHQTSFNEHQRMHNSGIPVSQLRKCYIGARVKKTVREQLEELRTKDSSSADSASRFDASLAPRPKKRKSTGEEPMRKRVHARDKHPTTQLLKQFAANRSMSNLTSLRQHPRYPSTFAQSYIRDPFPNLPNPVVGGARRSDGSLNRFVTPYANTPPAHEVVTNPPPLYSPTSVAQPQHREADPTVSEISPVQQTLALLGIPFSSAYAQINAHASANRSVGLSADQIRRRLMIRETSADVGARSEASSSRNEASVSLPSRIVTSTTFDPGIRRSRSLNVPLTRAPIRSAHKNNDLPSYPDPGPPFHLLPTLTRPPSDRNRDYL